MHADKTGLDYCRLTPANDILRVQRPQFRGRLAIIILILIILLETLHIKWTQSALTHYTAKYLQHKWGIPVSIGQIRFTLSYRFEINDIYLEDQQWDTLL